VKLLLQITLGVFLGTLSSQLVIDHWHAHQEEKAKQAAEKIRAERVKVRFEQGERIRSLLIQGRQRATTKANKAPAGFLPDDAQSPIPNEEQH
jgi:hypothetical protein